MGSLLPKSEYVFKNLDKKEYEQGKVFYFYCDNLQEGIHVLSWMEEYNEEMHLIKRGYNGISNYISIYDINGEKYTIIICSFYHNGEIPRLVRQIINKIDKPDVVIYSQNEDKIICGIENTETAFVGNATWQRHGRIMNFLEHGFPFIFFAYYSKKDVSQDKPRKPSPLFVLSFFSITIKNSAPAIVSLYEHDDINQNIINKDGSKMIETRKDTLGYILSLMKNGQNSDITRQKLKKCFYNMKYYYKKEIGRVREKELPQETLSLLRKDNLEDEIIEKIENKDKDYPLFFEGNKSNGYLLKWNPVSEKIFDLEDEKVGIGDFLRAQFYGVDFYQLSPKCPAGITFDTEKLANRLNELKDTGYFYWEDSLNLDIPTIMIPIKLTKNGVPALPDPYNGRIPAFYEMYEQSFGDINCIMYLMDHSNKNEYNPYYAKGSKIYKTINHYATIFIDRDLNILEEYTGKGSKDSKGKYKEGITEDNVTCFFETILKMENIVPSFINPPCGSWSDLKLFPTDKFLYLKRDANRADIAYYIPEKGTYYVGESKISYSSFKNAKKYNKQVDRINELVGIIDKEIKMKLDYKTFIIFKGTTEEGTKIVEQIHNDEREHIDYIVVIEENNLVEEDNIKMVILEV